MSEIARSNGVDPDRVSFTRSLRAARRSVRAGLGTSKTAITEALRLAIAEIARELLPERRLRAAGRVIKRKMSNWGLKRGEHRDWPQPTLRSPVAVRVLGVPP